MRRLALLLNLFLAGCQPATRYPALPAESKPAPPPDVEPTPRLLPHYGWLPTSEQAGPLRASLVAMLPEHAALGRQP